MGKKGWVMLQSPSLLGVVTEALTAISKGSEGGTEDIDTLRLRGFLILRGFLELKWLLKQLPETMPFGRRRRWLTVADTAHAETWILAVDIWHRFRYFVASNQRWRWCGCVLFPAKSLRVTLTCFHDIIKVYFLQTKKNEWKIINRGNSCLTKIRILLNEKINNFSPQVYSVGGTFFEARSLVGY